MIQNTEHSFAVLAYRESPYIEACIQSLKKQTVQSQIYISTSTPSPFLNDISRKYHAPLLVNKNRDSIASDWTFAYEQCSTRYVTLAHQDDLYVPDYTALCIKLLKDRIKSLIVFTNYSELDKDTVRNYNPRLLIKKILLFPYIIKSDISNSFLKKLSISFGNQICCPSVMYNKEQIGDFGFSKKFEINLDWEAWFKLARMTGSFIYNNKRLMIHRIHENAESQMAIHDTRRIREDKEMFNLLWSKPTAQLLTTLYSLSRRKNK